MAVETLWRVLQEEAEGKVCAKPYTSASTTVQRRAKIPNAKSQIDYPC